MEKGLYKYVKSGAPSTNKNWNGLNSIFWGEVEENCADGWAPQQELDGGKNRFWFLPNDLVKAFETDRANLRQTIIDHPEAFAFAMKKLKGKVSMIRVSEGNSALLHDLEGCILVTEVDSTCFV